MSVDCTLQHVRHAEADEIFVCRQVAGELALEQAGRDLLLKEGDMTLLDPLMPYSGRFSAESKLLVLRFRGMLLKRASVALRTSRRDASGHSMATAAWLPVFSECCQNLLWSKLGCRRYREAQALDLVAVALAEQ